MVKQIIEAHHHPITIKPKDDNFLRVSEFFYDTIQGEGIYIGQPAAFLRLQGCSLNCSYCDSTEVWRTGSAYSFEELFKLMEGSMVISKLETGQHLVITGGSMVISKLETGQHLVITGGSPLLQQENLYKFIHFFMEEYHFKPFIEIENECVILPFSNLTYYVDCWNNSPKLASSEIDFEKRYKPEVIKFMSHLHNSWFKFVISSEEDWEEIEAGFLMPGYIQRNQIILMPKGETRTELELYRPMTVQMAVENGVRYSSREHIVLFDKKTGV